MLDANKEYYVQIIQRRSGQRSEPCVGRLEDIAKTLKGTELDVEVDDDSEYQGYVLVLADQDGQMQMFPLMVTAHFIQYVEVLIAKKEEARADN